ncbi:MAG: EF-hand domain-containing protein [Planctomycetes bacterium]|nr:EF-hand domain-containing protein [Planctomycetota bacterium]
MKAAPLCSVGALLVASTAVLALPQRGAGPAQGRGGDARPAPDAGRAGPAAQDDLSAVHFRTADWDGDGVLRFSEAEQSLGLDRAAFALYDADRDGVISPEEFAGRYRRVVERGGVFAAPRPRPDGPLPTRRDGPALLAAFDENLDGMLVAGEVARALQAARLDDPPAATVLATLDTDRSGGLEGAELEAFAALLDPAAAPERLRPRLTLDELFDRRLPRDARTGSTIGPLRTAGPVAVFRRLDHDRSGRIDLHDLEELQRPGSGVVRPAVVVATLDLDGDGAISPEEFAAAMRGPRAR